MLASIFTAAVAFYVVYGKATYAPSSVGFVLAMASENIFFLMRHDDINDSSLFQRVNPVVGFLL